MSLAIPPVLVLGLLVALVTTQLATVASPRRPPYLVKLGISILAVLLGEAAARLGLAGRLAFGELHPLHDLLVLVPAQWLASRLARGRV